ncbi:MFS transporter [Picrophilus oshimae]|uniref:Drug resistance transporter, EmrB/QacA subfamily n=1 Tax=Picrophilus torridus (strain ATCC 700027 / DSM 9790 / JCM 10055 / NBRC 100828 / KAW 2/3) TaxID=1122961 RepID=A0A8G2FWY1_PICTO|nr:MFS transporter [Picrophilus oshimae]SMD30983.1 drug resistance transporter, EmrB/QacA subfamily [Picrophilus oshimae DSM 9789]
MYQPTKRDINITIALMAFTGTLIVYVETMIVPALPVFVKFFDTKYNDVSWILTAYIISGTVSAAIFGRLADIIGKRKVFLILSLIYAMAVSAGGFAQTLGELIAIRAIQGLGFGLFPIAFAIINDIVPKERLALAQGILSATFAIGSGIGLVLGAWITEDLGWQYSYHTAIPVAFALFILAFIYLKDFAEPRREKIDFVGVALLGIGLISLIYALSEGQTIGWTSFEIIFMFVMSLVFFAAFVLFERSYKYAFIDMGLLKRRNVITSNFVGLFAMAAMYFLFFTVPTMLQDPSPSGFGKTILESGIIMLPATIMNMVFAPVAARVTTVRGPRLSIYIGLAINFFGFLLLLMARSSVIDILFDSMFVGAGISFMLVGIINVLLRSVPKERSGEATGMNTVFRDIGMSIAPAVGGAFETMYSIPVMLSAIPVNYAGLPLMPIYKSFPAPTAYNFIYLIGILFVVIGFLLTGFIKNPVNK